MTLPENPYPKDIFTPVPKREMKKIVKLLQDNGYSPDCLFGHWGRQVWDNCLGAVKQTLYENWRDEQDEINL